VTVLMKIRRQYAEACKGWGEQNISRFSLEQVFFKENVRYKMLTCRDPISLILGTRWWFIFS